MSGFCRKLKQAWWAILIALVIGVLTAVFVPEVANLLKVKIHPLKYYFNVISYTNTEKGEQAELKDFDVYVDNDQQPTQIYFDKENNIFFIEFRNLQKHYIGIKRKIDLIGSDTLAPIEDQTRYENEHKRLIEHWDEYKKNRYQPKWLWVFHRYINPAQGKKGLFFLSPKSKLLNGKICNRNNVLLYTEGSNFHRKMRSIINKSIQIKIQNINSSTSDSMIVQTFFYPNKLVEYYSKDNNKYSFSFPVVAMQPNIKSDEERQSQTLEKIAALTRSLIVIKPWTSSSDTVKYYIEQGFDVYTDLRDFHCSDIYEDMESFKLAASDRSLAFDLISDYYLSIEQYRNGNREAAYETLINLFAKTLREEEDRLRFELKDFNSVVGIVGSLRRFKYASSFSDTLLLDRIASRFLTKYEPMYRGSLSKRSIIDEQLNLIADLSANQKLPMLNNLYGAYLNEIENSDELRQDCIEEYSKIFTDIFAELAFSHSKEMDITLSYGIRNYFQLLKKSRHEEDAFNLLQFFWTKNSAAYVNNVTLFCESLSFLLDYKKNEAYELKNNLCVEFSKLTNNVSRRLCKYPNAINTNAVKKYRQGLESRCAE